MRWFPVNRDIYNAIEMETDDNVNQCSRSFLRVSSLTVIV